LFSFSHLPVLRHGFVVGQGGLLTFAAALVILVAGILFSLHLRFLPQRMLPLFLVSLLQQLSASNQKKPERGITSFQAMTTSLAATIGTGNIAGVATAISLGGPGAVFWLWISGFFGMAIKYSEVVLGVHFHRCQGNNCIGGPMYYLSNGAGMPFLAVAYAFLGTASAFGIGNLIQANTVASVAEAAFNIPPLLTGIVMAAVVASVIIGGAGRVACFTQRLVPLMAAIYLLAALLILCRYADAVPSVFSEIIGCAFTGRAAAGGFGGAGLIQAVNYGISRGIFSNEAGLGSAAIAHSLAAAHSPGRQGLWAVLEVFIDTHCICTVTALALLVTGAWMGKSEGAGMTADAFSRGLPWGGELVVALGLIMFAFSTLIAWSVYGEKCLEYLLNSTQVSSFYRLVWCITIVWGVNTEVYRAWYLADILNGMIVIPNLIGLACLTPLVARLSGNIR